MVLLAYKNNVRIVEQGLLVQFVQLYIKNMLPILASTLFHYCQQMWYIKIEGQAFLRSYDSVLGSPTPFPNSPVSKLSLFLSLPVCRRSSLLTGEGEGGGHGAESFDSQESLALYKSFNTLCSVAIL
jgi:hypothetical protein